MINNTQKLAVAALAGLLTAGVMAAPVAAYAGEHGEKGAAMEKTAKEKHACKGMNSCKGQGADGKNECKGKGTCATDGSKPAGH